MSPCLIKTARVNPGSAIPLLGDSCYRRWSLALVPGADQREARGSQKLRWFWPLHLPPFPSHRRFFGTARSGPGRAVYARRRRIFCRFEKILRSGPWTARTVLKYGAEGKGGQAADGLENASGYNSGSDSLCLIAERPFSYRVEPLFILGARPRILLQNQIFFPRQIAADHLDAAPVAPIGGMRKGGFSGAL